MDLINISILIVALGNLILGTYSFLQNKKNKVNRTFAYLSYSVVAWCLTMVIYRAAADASSSILTAKFLYASAAFTAYWFLLFTFVFPLKQNGLKNIYKILIALPFVLMVLSSLMPDWIIGNVILKTGQEKQIIFGQVYWLYVFYIPIYFSWGFFNLIKKYLKVSGLYKMQVRYIFIGSFTAAFLGMITNLTLPTFGIFALNWLGQILTIIFIGFITYAILRYRLMDIRIAIRGSAVYLLIAAFVYGFFHLCVWFFNNMLGGIYTRSSLILGAFIAVIFVILFFLFEKLTRKIANKYFFGTLYSKHETLQKLSQRLTTIIDLEKLLNAVSSVILKSLNINKISILLKNGKSSQYLIQKNIKFKQDKLESLIKFNFLAQYLEKNNKPIFYAEIESTREQEGLLKIKKQMQYLNAHLILPLISKNQLHGMVVLGKKLSNEAYTKEDMELLESLANQTSMAIDNASLYNQVKDLSENLQEKVQEQTQDIRAKAEDIKGLLDMKSELLRTISHQLRTPTSIFRGMLSMIGEKGKEALSQDEREEFIEKSLAAADRLVIIINSITEANELQAEKARINFNRTNIEEVIKDSITIFKRTAKEKNIELKFVKPEKPIHEIVADPEYIKSALEKLIDNAIWYSEKGSTVEISASHNEQDETVSIKVKDNGIGLTDEDKKILFTQFGRGRGSKTMNVNSSGLGLFIVKKITDAHKGQIIAESDGEDKGSCFILTLPIMSEI